MYKEYVYSRSPHQLLRQSKYFPSAFTLVELLTTIVIIAVLVTAVLVFVPSFTSWARQTNDKRTLVILNDALTRYKTEGGSLAALTSGAPAADVLALLRSPITWGSITHQVMQTGATYPARSLSATGSGSNYHFYQYGTFTDSNAPAPGPTYPYGAGVGYASNSNNASGYAPYIQTDGGYFVIKTSDGVYYYANAGSNFDIPQCQSITFWACAGNGDPTPSGHIIVYEDGNTDNNDYSSNLTSLDVSGLTSLQHLECQNNQLTALNLTNNSALTFFDCGQNQLTSLDVSNNSALQTLYCTSNLITSLTVTNKTSLTDFRCQSNSLTSLNVSGCTALSILYCESNNLSSVNITGDHSLPARSTDTSTTFDTDVGVTVVGP